MYAKILSLSARDGMTDGENPAPLAELVAAQNPDIAYFPEAYAEQYGLSMVAWKALDDQGYEVYDTDNAPTESGDDDARLDRHGMVLAIKREITHEASVAELIGRNALMLTFAGSAVRLGAAHFLDRLVLPVGRQSVSAEKIRQQQARDLIRLLGRNAVAVGSFGTMPHNARGAGSLRALELPLRFAPSVEPDPYRTDPKPVHGLGWKLRRVASLASRLAAMADGGTYDQFMAAGYASTTDDPVPTLAMGPFSAQLDHCFVKGEATVVEPTRVVRLPGLDHRGIMTTVNIPVPCN